MLSPLYQVSPPKSDQVSLDLHFIFSSIVLCRAGPIQMLNILWINPLPTWKYIFKCPKSSPCPCWKVKLVFSGSWIYFHLAEHSALCGLWAPSLGHWAWLPKSASITLSVPSNYSHIPLGPRWLIDSSRNASVAFFSLFVPGITLSPIWVAHCCRETREPTKKPFLY